MEEGAQKDKYKAVFGSESELSDSDDDQRKDTRPTQSRARSPTRSSSPASSRSPSPPPAAVRRRSVTPSDESEADGYASAEDDRDDAKAKLKAKRAQVGEKRKREKSDKVKQKREKRPQKNRDEDGERSPDAEVPEMDEATRRRYELEKRMDAALKSGKKKRKAKKGEDDINIDNQADEEVADTYSHMVKAVQDDHDLNVLRKPASNKVKILPRVMAILQNATMQQSILDSPDFLQGIRQFLEPLNDGSLPSLTIQRSIFEQLKKMDITKEILKESGLGKIILFYTKTKKATPEITRQANLLYDKWTRLVVNQGSVEHQHTVRQQRDESEEDERDRERDRAREGGQPKRKKDIGGDLLRQKVESRNDEELGGGGSKSTRIPSQVGHAYHEAPQPIRSRKDAKEEDAAEARRREMEKLNRFKRKAQLASSGR